MQLKSIETTPNPNSMKLNFNEDFGKAVTYASSSSNQAPSFVHKLLNIPGIQSVFVCADFLTLNKDPRFDWKPLLETATKTFENSDGLPLNNEATEPTAAVHVFVQTFRGIPIQVKATDPSGESRVSLGERFNAAAMALQEHTGADYLKERRWADYGMRKGDRESIAQELAEELRSTFAETDLDKTAAEQDGSEQDIQTLTQSLNDPNQNVRRLAAAGLGATGNPSAIPALCHALLNDTSVGVRRTAGDALSDIGDASAEPSICKALSDPNKLVRWRAARFLSEVGTEDALPALTDAANDSEFEVRLEVQAAIQRIRGGEKGLGPAWKRIVEGGI